MSKRSRDKGKRGEREAAAVLRAIGIDGARRGVQYQGGPDSPDVVAIPGVHIEVKRTERLKLSAALKQASEERRCDEVPAVLHRSNRGPWVLSLALVDVPGFVERWRKATEVTPL